MDHVHDHAHEHGHSHGHDHPHGHGHGAGDYYLEQLLTVGICAAFAVVAVMMYRGGTLNFVLVKDFHPWVFGGGVALFVLAVVRAVALWRATAPKEHDHGPDCDHSHGADCGHDHAAHDHGDHSHGSIFWKVV